MTTRNRDDFAESVRRVAAQRVNLLCSNPDCRAQTGGPQINVDKALNLGVAAHIAAASPEGPRYDSNQSPAERSAADNAIWLCQNCAKLVDNDPRRFTSTVLRGWKEGAESYARDSIGRPNQKSGPAIEDKWVSMPYVRTAGIIDSQTQQGYECRWARARDEAERVDVDGWERVVFTQTDGRQFYLKVKDPGAEYVILLRKPK